MSRTWIIINWNKSVRMGSKAKVCWINLSSLSKNNKYSLHLKWCPQCLIIILAIPMIIWTASHLKDKILSSLLQVSTYSTRSKTVVWYLSCTEPTSPSCKRKNPYRQVCSPSIHKFLILLSKGFRRRSSIMNRKLEILTTLRILLSFLTWLVETVVKLDINQIVWSLRVF